LLERWTWSSGFQTALQVTFFSLSQKDEWGKALQKTVSADGPAPDGRRPFGSVRDAIARVLAEADGDLRVRDIHTGVERLLNGPMSPTSVTEPSSRNRPPVQATRKFAAVGDAVIQALAEADGNLRFVEIHNAVEPILGSPVSRSSVKNYLARGCQRRRPVLERISHGRYRLIG
jgi:hypothetical protein